MSDCIIRSILTLIYVHMYDMSCVAIYNTFVLHVCIAEKFSKVSYLL